MKCITFYVFDENELKAWIDILAEIDADWNMSVIRNTRNPDKKVYEITAMIKSEDYDKLCHLAYQQYYNYVCCV